jgi:hypothetical protein
VFNENTKPRSNERKKNMMTLRILKCFVIILAGMALACTPLTGDKHVEQMKRTTWQMTMHLETKNLKPPAVQWTVFEKDPVPGFHSRVRQMKGYYTEQLDGANSKPDKELRRSSMISVSWNLGFGEVTGDKVYLLTRARGVSHGFSSNEPDGKKWIVSKTVQIKGKPVCWCIPVTVETGKETQVILNMENMFDLRSAFDEAMGAEE